jgi:hypothetical protein
MGKSDRESRAARDIIATRRMGESLRRAEADNKTIRAYRDRDMQHYFGGKAPKEGERIHAFPGFNIPAGGVVETFRKRNPYVGIHSNFGIEIPGAEIAGVEVRASRKKPSRKSK